MGGLRHQCCCLLLALALAITARPALAYNNRELIDGFNKTVFGSEYSGLLSQAYVRKFPGRVRFYVKSSGSDRRLGEVQRFILSLRKLIHGLKLQLVYRERDANFVVHLVKRRHYERTVRNDVYKRRDAPVVGRCMVRSVFTRSGISRSDAVIVTDEGLALFRRCMTEEILQGLGPLNDDRSLVHSMFNDTSRYTGFRRFDRFILNMLYDPIMKNGFSQREAGRILPRVLRRARRRIEG